MPSNEAEQFSLKTGSNEFTARLNSVFDSISNLEKDHEDWERNQDSMQNARLWKQEPGEEISSLENTFKRPRNFPVKRSLQTLDYVPNFRRNPSKWTKYSLANVPELSERSNARAALSFLDDRKRQKLDLAEEAHSTTTGPEKIIFHKPHASTSDTVMESSEAPESEKQPEDTSQCPASGAGKFVMPECVVGAKRTGSRKTSLKQRPCLLTAIHLEHLEEEEENEIEQNRNERQEQDDTRECASGFRKLSRKEPKKLKEKVDNDEEDEHNIMDVE